MNFLELGIGIQDITPQVGLPLSGFIARQNHPSSHIDSPLWVRALAVRGGEGFSLLFSFDLLGITAELEQQIFDQLQDQLGTGFSSQRCLLTATHNHSGPALGLLVGEAAPDPVYVDLLAGRAVRAACLAVENMQPVQFYTAEVRVPGLTYNRRALLVDGRVSISPVPDLPVIQRGALDDRLTVMVARNPAGKNVAGIMHFACHGVSVLSQGIGADIPGELAARIGTVIGAPCLFLQGAAGDVNPATVTARRDDLLTWVDQAMAFLQDMNDRLTPVNSAAFQVINSQIPLFYAPLPAERLAEDQVKALNRIAAGDFASPDLQDAVQSFKNTMNLRPDQPLDPLQGRFIAWVLAQTADKTLSAIRSGGQPPPQTLRCALWRMGSWCLALVAGEIFSSTGLRIRSLTGHMTVLPVSYLSPLLGYLPEDAALPLGGYEVSDAWRFYGHPAPFEMGTEARILDHIAHLVSQMVV